MEKDNIKEIETGSMGRLLQEQKKELLRRKIRAFIVSANNTLMGIQVHGDNILRSAAIMNEAHALLKELDSDD